MYSENTRHLTLSGYVGFDHLPNQIIKRRLQENFTFNILCVGETGIGKSTLISSLFNIEVYTSGNRKHTNSTVILKTRKYDLKLKEVPLRLSVTETVGFGDQIDRKGNFEPILNYVDSQYEKYLQEELKIKRNLTGYQDTRIHVCLYFICPTGHTLKSSDLLLMKQLCSKVNLIPLIAKADILTMAELENFKSNIRNVLQRENIEIQKFHFQDETAGEFKVVDDVPFAVVGSTDFVEKDEKLQRVRIYPWGTIYINEEGHSDFVKLRELLVEKHMEDLSSLTHTRNYENYRKERLKQLGVEDLQSGDEHLNFVQKLDSKLVEMRQKWQTEEEERLQSYKEKVKNIEVELAEEEQRIKLKCRAMQEEYEKEQAFLKEEKDSLLREMHLFYK